ncbi:transglutaminase domain-containing protein [Candidatus Daviesbacteria bacterium]|nr:transglutaminase domain-containing protein [Candidatus Daviesbacteria bacterium]
MLKKALIIACFLGFLLFTPQLVLAQDQFQTSYAVTYDISESGETLVSENISLKNLTDRFYASNFNLTTSSTKLVDVVASDNQGPLEVNLAKQANKTEIKVKFAGQVVGLGKDYQWNLKYKSLDFAQKQGQVWQIFIPKISSTTPSDDYKVTLQVPVSFGDPSSINPKPKSESEIAGKLVLTFDKKQLIDNGILANFGNFQYYKFNLKFNLTNNNFLPSLEKIPLPPQTEYQDIIISKIDPKPENVTIDQDGNFLAWYKIEPRKSIQVSIEGLSKLSFTPKDPKPILSKEQSKDLISAKTFWEKDNPAISQKLAEIFKNGEPSSVLEKARLINQFVVNNLKYSDLKILHNDFQRLGGLTALNNPDNALCLEFSDLFISLARAANIPTQELIGYAYTENSDLRPLSFQKNLLHVWPEYFDPDKGWVMIDPTWQQTSGGVDYFDNMDLNHLVLAIRGSSSTFPSPPNEAQIEFNSNDFNPSSDIKLELVAPAEIFAGFSNKIKVRVQNQGNFLASANTLKVSASELNFNKETNFTTPNIPPFGFVEYELNLKPTLPWQSFEDVLEAKFEDKIVNQKIVVKPFFAAKIFPFASAAVVGAMICFYILVLFLHRKHSSKLIYKVPHKKA